jgi:hypothetical protein
MCYRLPRATRVRALIGRGLIQQNALVIIGNHNNNERKTDETEY